MFCPNCGTKNEDGAVFCVNCGHRLGRIETPREAAAEEPGAEPQETAEEGVGAEPQETVEEGVGAEPQETVEERVGAEPQETAEEDAEPESREAEKAADIPAAEDANPVRDTDAISGSADPGRDGYSREDAANYRNPHPNLSRGQANGFSEEREEYEAENYYDQDETKSGYQSPYAIENDEEYRRTIAERAENRRRQRNQRVILGAVIAGIAVLAVILVLVLVQPSFLPIFGGSGGSDAQTAVAGSSAEIDKSAAAVTSTPSATPTPTATPSAAPTPTVTSAITATPTPESSAAAPTATPKAKPATASKITATPAPAKAAEQSGTYILPDSGSRVYSLDELRSYSSSTLQMAINEMYAKRGYKFYDSSVQEYFNSQSWYHANDSLGYAKDLKTNPLSATEQENIKQIRAIQNGG